MLNDRSHRAGRAALLAALTMAALAACDRAEGASADTVAAADRTTYGERVAIGQGWARTYITSVGGVPAEVGVALSEGALAGLPGHHAPGGVFVHGHTTFEYVLGLPAGNGTPFRHVLVNWNPGGHEPPGIYDSPHFDFHFYLTENAERLAIDPADPKFQARAERRPPAELIPRGYILPAPLAFPRMGVHWVDPTSPELNGKPFTATFIYGSWDGKVIFAEPMLTKAFLESKPRFSADLPQPARGGDAGRYPGGYSVRWDEGAREWRIALRT